MPTQSGYMTAQELDDYLQSVDHSGRDLDPAGVLGTFTVPGLPIAVAHRPEHRGRLGDSATIKPNYVSKGVLPL